MQNSVTLCILVLLFNLIPKQWHCSKPFLIHYSMINCWCQNVFCVFTFCKEEEEENESSWAGSHCVPTHSTGWSSWAILPGQHLICCRPNHCQGNHVGQSSRGNIISHRFPLSPTSLFVLIEALLYPSPLLIRPTTTTTHPSVSNIWKSFFLLWSSDNFNVKHRYFALFL